MTVADYLGLWASETQFQHPHAPAVARQWRSALRTSLARPLWAVRDAPSSSGRYPLVIYAPGSSGAAWENADLCEYLASHGYVVIAAPSLGVVTRAMTHDAAGMSAQARDITFLIDFAAQLPYVAHSKVGVVGFSWGGISNVVAASKDSRIGALVGLDGSVRYYPGWLRQIPDVHPEEMRIPLLDFVERNFAPENEGGAWDGSAAVGPNVLNLWRRGDLLKIHMMGMSHAEFGSMWQRNDHKWSEFAKYEPIVQGDFGRSEAMLGYAWMSRYALAFLDAYVKSDTAAKAFLAKSPQDNGVPRHVLATQFRPAQIALDAFDAFRARVGVAGFPRVAEIFSAFRTESPSFQLDQEDLLAWAIELEDRDDFEGAVALLRFNVSEHPRDAGSHIALSEAYMLAGERTHAIESFETARRLDPTSDQAAWFLEEN